MANPVSSRIFSSSWTDSSHLEDFQTNEQTVDGIFKQASSSETTESPKAAAGVCPSEVDVEENAKGIKALQVGDAPASISDVDTDEDDEGEAPAAAPLERSLSNDSPDLGINPGNKV